ncbi:MAG TPA: M28 family peptidase [Solirubrobacteraceae bacterium]|nr:M28 family peptidase [Solirubrobacteraceae bacterium]
MRATLLAAALAAAAPAQDASPARTVAHDAAVHLARDVGSRPAASRAERRAHRWVARRFAAAGLDVRTTPFAVPGKGRSRNVVGVRDGPRRCLKVVMAHADSVDAGPGANDNASGVGVVVALAGRLDAIRPPCDVWLVATGAEERPYTGAADHLGARALVRELRRRRAARRLRYALSLDMVGRGRRFQLRSPRPRPRPGVERELLAAGRRRGVPLRWLRDSGSGNSDHRELELAGLPGLVLQVWRGEDACYHRACDGWRRLQPAALARVQGLAESVLRRR